MNIARVLLGACLVLLVAWCRAEPLTVAPNSGTVSLTPHLRLLQDPQGQLQFREVLQPQAQQAFQPVSGNAANFGFSSAAYWATFTLRNDSEQPLPLVIRQDYPLIDYLEFWAEDASGQWQHTATGDREPFASRALPLRDFVFPVLLPPHSERTYYMRFATQGSLNIGLSVSGETAFLPELGLEQFLLGIYYGGFLVLVIYNLFLFLAVRDRAYVYYMGYAISYGLYFGVHNGVSFQFLWPQNPWLGNEILIVLLGLSLIFAIQFARKICSGRQLSPRLDWVARNLMWALVPLTLLAPVFGYRLMILVFSALTLVICILLLAMGTMSLLRGSVSARYFMVAWVTLLGSVIVYMLKTFGVLPHNGFTQNAFQVGALVEMVLLSLALGARVSEIHKRGYIDELSRLYNRRHFDEQLPREFCSAARNSTPLSLLMLDLDHFKSINDRYGHSQGDRAIHAIGQLILKQVRKPVLACRYGGEEFAILLPRTSGEQAAAVAERLVSLVAELELDEMSLTASIGVATFAQDNYASAVQLFEAADAALYRAKLAGRNRAEVEQFELAPAAHANTAPSQ
ncbi:diguanylate cyclase [uncultured Microbulbifer sp.]|uniref:diguanylate cyclase n=1 Tax=uncultured Microbulbifer sp. TaxID=348147 RepID=UPI0025D6A842|nr:diguanylate cyclase [uncultured Microbulbifer sp.]